jgi:4,5-DOPA dioxygenase extradiol
MSGIASTSMVRQPVLFVGHGSPMNAIEDNQWSRALRDLGQLLPTPRAILAISAHWFVGGSFVTSNEQPETIHDFGGFPAALYEMQYPARGDAVLAERVVALLGKERSSLRSDWGLDHGTWSVLHHLRPEADRPVVQLSLNRRLPHADHLALGRALRPLRDEGVLILASGNLTHNLAHAFGSLDSGDTTTPDWARRFDDSIAAALERRDRDFLLQALDSDDGRLAHPTREHYLPLLYAVGAADDGARVSFPVSGFDLGSLSMRAVLFA